MWNSLWTISQVCRSGGFVEIFGVDHRVNLDRSWQINAEGVSFARTRHGPAH